MAIKKLQNNFTTPEQSKRLLELGVPADSADCYLQNESQDKLAYVNYTTYIIQPFHNKQTMFLQQEDFIPCWSVGRLMEIYLICKSDYSMGLHFESVYDWDEKIVDSICDLFYAAIKCGNIDFSKLEE